MQFATSPRSTRKQTKARIQSAVLPVIELVEQRVLFSTTIAGWNFDSVVINTTTIKSVGTLTPSADVNNQASGTPVAYSIGMQTSSSGGYLYPTPNATAGNDSSNVLNGTGNNTPANEDNSSTGQTAGTDGTGINPAWRIVGGSGNGWSDTAATGSQGAQFDVNTTGYSNVTMTFDIDASSTKAPAQFMIEYTTNVSATNPTWTNVSTISGGTSSNNGASDGISVLTNSSNSNIVDGSYFQFANNTDGLFWQNGESVTFPAAAADQSGFAVRIVNAATGTSLTTVNGATYGGSGNWRLDNVSIAGTAVDTNQPQVTTQPTIPSTVIAGSSVTLTAAASHYTSVRWYVQSAGTSGFNPIQNATSLSYTFTTSTSSADNGNEYEAIFTNSNITSGPNTATTNVLTLNDPQVGVTIPTNGNPSPESVNPSGTATFTAAANGSPVPTVQWQSSPDNGGPNNTDWTNISNATATTYSFTASVSNNGTYYPALFTNPASPNGVATSSAKLTVSGVSLADYNFNATEAAGSAYTTLNSSSVPSGVSYAGATSATLQAVGMTLSGTTDKEDITQPGGTVNGSTTAYGWRRVRGTGSGSNGDTNGWWTGAPQYSQGAEFDVNTSGYDFSTLNFDWFATTSGPRDLMVQYNLNTSNSSGWTNALSSPLVAVSNNWDGSTTPTDTVSLSGLPAGANNDPNFGLRLVSAYDPTYAAANGGANEYTTASSTNSAWTQISNTAGNWSFNNVQLVGSIAPSAASIPTNGNPTNTTVTTGANATFTAIANGYPAPTATWQNEAPGSSTWTPLTSGFVDNQGATSDTSTLTIASTTQSETGYQYEAVFTNTSGSPATTAPATLTVDSIPVITTDPSSVGVNGGQSVTLTSVATGNPTPTPQWYVATPNGTGGFNSFNAINNATSPNYTFTPSEASGGDEYEVIYTNTVNGVISSATSTPAVVSVIGQPIDQFDFSSSIGAPAGGADTQGNDPPYSLAVEGTPVASPIGFLNNYYGIPTTPEADVLPVASTVNTQFSEYVWRLRGGASTNTTSGAGRPDGWSALAPEDTQGAQFSVDTSGYSNITLHFDWNEGGIGDMQAQYQDASGNWDNIGSAIASTTKDYAGISSSTTPTGITVSLQGIAYANDNPSLQVRLVSAYAPTTEAPAIVDANTNLTSALHGQFIAAGPAGNTDAEQLLQIPDIATTASFSFNGSGPSTSVTLDPTNPSATASAIATALQGLSSIGSGNVTVTESPNDSTGTQYVVTFTGSLADTAEPNLISTSAYNYLVTTGVQASNTGTGYLSLTDGSGTYTVPVTPNESSAVRFESALQASGATNASSFTVADAHDDGGWVGYAVNISGDTVATLSIGSVGTLPTPGMFAVTTPFQQNQIGGTASYQIVYDGVNTGDASGNQGSWEIGNISFNGYGANEGGIGIVTQPTSQTATATYPLTLSATAYSETPITGVQWEYSTSSAGTYTDVPASGTSFSDTSGTSFSSSAAPDYSSSYTFTPPTSWENSTYYFEAVFTNSSGGMQTTVPATIPVVAPVAPTLVTLPSSAGAEAGQDVVYYAAATGSPAPTVDWQLLSSNGTEIQDISSAGSGSAHITNTTSTYNGQPESLSTLVYTTTASEIEAGDQVVAIYTNNAGTVGSYGTSTSDAAPMNVFSAETSIAAWNFDATGAASGYSDSPAPTTGTGTATLVGMTVSGGNDPNAAPAGGYSLPDGDITNTAGTIDSSFSENLFRIRGGPGLAVTATSASATSGTATLTVGSTVASEITPGGSILVTGLGIPGQLRTNIYNTDSNGNPIPFQISSINVSAGTITYVIPGSSANVSTTTISSSGTLYIPTNKTGGTIGAGAPGNGWSQAANSYTQGVQFSTSTQGYNNIYVTADAYSTTSGILDGELEYTTDGSTWNQLEHFQMYTNDYYGANLDGTGAPIPLVFDLSNVPAANNNPNFGVRIVSVQNSTLANEGEGPYAIASSTDNNPQPWSGASGNWRVGNVTIHGVPNWLSDASQAIYTPATNSLVVTGPATIISDPMSPDSIFGAGTNIPVAPDVTAESASATINVDPQLSQGSSPVSTDVHLGGVHLTDGASMQVASMNDENSDHVDNHNTLVIGAATGQATAPEFDIDGEHAITSATASGTTVTVTTNGGTYAVGDSVRIMQLTANFSDGSTQELDGSYTVTGLVTNGFTFTGPSTLASTTPSLTSVSYGPAGTVFKDGADISAASASGLAVTLTVPGTYTVGQTISLAGVMASFDDGTTASLNGTYTVASLTTGGFTINVPTTLDPNSTNITGVTLGNTPTVNASTLDLQDNDLIVHGGDDGSNDLWAVQAASAEARDAAPGGFLNGTWDGAGLTSSVAQATDAGFQTEATILGVELNSDKFAGALASWNVGTSTELLNSNDVLVKYTYSADPNLDGYVSDSDVACVNQFYTPGQSLASQGTTDNFAYGDLNGDGFTDDTDVATVNQLYGTGLPASGVPTL